MSMQAQDYIAAARVPHTLQPKEFGRWTIKRILPKDEIHKVLLETCCGRPMQTILYRLTDATLHTEHGDVVMEDSDQELRRHLPIWMHGRGRILITGLGLGCVVRGLLKSPHIEHIDVVEIDADIIRIVGAEFAGDPRVAIHHGNALTYEWPDGTTWDYAWHDLYCDNGKLAFLHIQLLARFKPMVKHRQGAWDFPKHIKRRCGRMMLK